MDGLTSREKKHLEFFWNEKKSEPSKYISNFIVAYLVTGELGGVTFTAEMAYSNSAMLDLRKKGYVELGSSNSSMDVTLWSLTTEGVLHLRACHPRFKEYLKVLISSTPQIVIIITGLIGFVSAIFGIIQFFKP
jgi:preprotein translocase subunit Sss1